MPGFPAKRCFTGRQPTGDDTKRTKEVVNIIEKLVKEGARVCYLLPKFQDRLHVGWLYSQAGAEVRYSGCPLVEDFRYTVVDNRAALIGIPGSAGEKETTKKGYRISSEGLAAILREHFFYCYEESITYEEYLKYTIEHTGSSLRMLSRELKVDEAELQRISGR
jgi:hypothetical protein